MSRKKELLPPRAKAERDQDKSLERRTKTFFDLVLILMLCATGMGVIRRFAYPLYWRWIGKPVPLAHFDDNNPVPGDLSFTNMGLKSLSQDLFSGMPGVKALRLNNNLIGGLPKHVFHGLPNLQALHLDSNRIASVVSKTFSGLQKLRHLVNPPARPRPLNCTFCAASRCAPEAQCCASTWLAIQSLPSRTCQPALFAGRT